MLPSIRCRLLTFASLTVFAFTAVSAQEPGRPAPSAPPLVQFSGQVRWRSELDSRRTQSTETLLPHYLRSRLRATARPGDRVTVLLELQDSRFFGSGSATASRGTYDGSADAIDLHQAFGELDSLFGMPLRARVGRQEIALGNERLIGTGGWNQIGRSFDAARLTWTLPDGGVDAVAALLTTPSATSTSAQSLYALWLRERLARNIGFDIFAIADVNTTPLRATADSGRSVLERITGGVTTKMIFGAFDAELEGAVQTGSIAANDSTFRRDLRAFMASATLGLTLDTATRSRIVLVGTVLSGDPGADERHEAFNTLFGNGHGFYGRMDIVPDIVGDRGMVDLGAQFFITPAAGLRLWIEGHHFSPQRATTSFGQEFDLSLSWRMLKPFELTGGAGLFLPGPQLEARLGSDPLTWFFLSGLWSF